MADRIDGDAKTNRPALLAFAKASSTDLPEGIALAIADGSGRTTREMSVEERLVIAAELLQQAPVPAADTTVPFNGDFADRELGFARSIVAYNSGVTGVAVEAARAEATGRSRPD
jgi:hypothetical protein